MQQKVTSKMNKDISATANKKTKALKIILTDERYISTDTALK